MVDKKPLEKSFSVIVETENLGMAGFEDLEATLNTLKQQSLPIEKANEVLVIVGGHLSKEAQETVEDRYPWVTLHQVKEYLTYTQAKQIGAKLATGEIVVMADSDATYEPTWLENLLTLFEIHPDATGSCGNTRLSEKSIYTMSLNLTWMIQLSPKNRPPSRTNRFQFNNFAIKRKVMLEVPFPKNLPLYRGEIGVWKKRLEAEGHKFYRVPGAMALHAPPGNLIDYWYRMLVFGSDSVARADFTFNDKSETVEKRAMLKRLACLARLGKARIRKYFTGIRILLGEDVKSITYIIAGLPLALVNNSLIMLGGLIALFNRDFVLKRVNERERQHTV